MKLKITGRAPDLYEQFVLDTPGILDQIAFLGRLKDLVARHPAPAAKTQPPPPVPAATPEAKMDAGREKLATAMKKPAPKKKRGRR